MRCLPDGPGVFVDRIDVAKQVAFSTPLGAPDSVEASMVIDIHFVTMAELMAKPNLFPPELGTTKSQVVLRVQLQAEGKKLKSKVIPPDLSNSGIPSPIREELAELIAAAADDGLKDPEFDLAAITDSFDLPTPKSVRVALSANSVVVEYDSFGPPGNRLFPGQEWGLFMDVQPVLDFMLGKLPPELRSGLVATTAEWAPDGVTPRVKGGVSLDIGLLEFMLRLDMRLSMSPAAPGAKAKLRTDLVWDIEVDAITIKGVPLSLLLKLAGVPGAIAALVGEGVAELIELGLDGAAALADDEIVNAFAQIGAQRTGDRSFMREQELPETKMYGIELRLTSLLPSASGMTVGGKALVKVQTREPMSLSTSRFGRPFFPSNCRSSGGAKPQVHADQVRYYAGTSFHNMGRFCRARLLPPNPMASELIEPPLQAATAMTDAFGFDLTIQQASLLQSEVGLLVRTSRGTRYVNLGKPVPAVVDENGIVVNVIGHIWNCLTYATEDKRSLIFGNDPIHLTKEDVLPPLEDPRWKRVLEQAWGLEVQVVELTGLDPGEMVVYESSTHRVQVAADRHGRALVPGFSPAGTGVKPATLTRLNQGPLTEREVRILNSASLQGGGMLRPIAAGESFEYQGGLQRRPQWAEALRTMHIGASFLGALKTQDSGQEVSLNPQPLPPQPPDELAAVSLQPLPPQELGELNPQPLPPEPPPEENPLVRATGLRNVRALLAVPGADTDRLAIAVMKDGRKVILDGTSETPRVAGLVDGPLGRTVIKNGFAVSEAGGQLRIFEFHG